MAERHRYFSEDDLEVGVTRSQFKRLGRAKQLAYMKHWFETYYEDPVQETPRNDGEYNYVWGGPYDAQDELGDEFGELVSDERMQEAVELVEYDGTVEWAPTSQHPTYRASLERVTEEDDRPTEPEGIEDIVRRLEGGFPVSFGVPEDLAQREVVSRHLTALRKELASLPRSAPGIGHNGAPEDDEVPSVTEVEASIADIGSELDKAQPDALKVASAASLISRAGKWLRARFVKVAEKAVEDTIRVGLIWGTVSFSEGKALSLPDMIQTVTDAVIHWIHVIGALF